MNGYTQTLRVAFDRVDATRVFVFVFFLLATLAFWTQAEPFRTLQDYARLTDPTQSSGVRKYLTLLFSFTLCLFWLMRAPQNILEAFRSPIVIAVVLWFAFTCVVSSSPSLALNRLILALITVQIACAAPLLFSSIKDFTLCLGVGATIIVVLCYLGLLFAPDLSMHTGRDLTEQALTGDWRGIFAHKNDLSAMASIFIFIGILIARTGYPIWGTSLLLSSIVLLVMSGGKTSSLIIVPVIVGGFLAVRLRSSFLTAAVVVGATVFMAVITLGSRFFDPVYSFVAAIMPDPTFTGRNGIWDVAIQAIGQAPVFGYGYSVFWDNGNVFGVSAEGRVAAHSHNGFLETALSGGLIGLVLVLLWTLVLPLRQLRVVKSLRHDRRQVVFLDFITQVWLFGLLNASLEAVLFNRSNPVWFTVLIALGCIRHWSQATRQSR